MLTSQGESSNLKQLGNLAPTNKEDLLHVAGYSVSWRCDDLIIEVRENLNKLRILDNTKRPMAPCNPECNFHTVLVRCICWTMCKGRKGSRACRWFAIAKANMSYQIACTVVVSCPTYNLRRVPNICKYHFWVVEKIRLHTFYIETRMRFHHHPEEWRAHWSAYRHRTSIPSSVLLKWLSIKQISGEFIRSPRTSSSVLLATEKHRSNWDFLSDSTISDAAGDEGAWDVCSALASGVVDREATLDPVRARFRDCFCFVLAMNVEWESQAETA